MKTTCWWEAAFFEEIFAEEAPAEAEKSTVAEPGEGAIFPATLRGEEVGHDAGMKQIWKQTGRSREGEWWLVLALLAVTSSLSQAQFSFFKSKGHAPEELRQAIPWGPGCMVFTSERRLHRLLSSVF
ncbi:MAG: hypothetical protein R3F31_14705 [Verrucomicrobiales bacterium]